VLARHALLSRHALVAGHVLAHARLARLALIRLALTWDGLTGHALARLALTWQALARDGLARHALLAVPVLLGRHPLARPPLARHAPGGEGLGRRARRRVGLRRHRLLPRHGLLTRSGHAWLGGNAAHARLARQVLLPWNSRLSLGRVRVRVGSGVSLRLGNARLRLQS
jgi:hypothetical protein